jgi:hypothetical protein
VAGLRDLDTAYIASLRGEVARATHALADAHARVEASEAASLAELRRFRAVFERFRAVAAASAETDAANAGGQDDATAASAGLAAPVASVTLFDGPGASSPTATLSTAAPDARDGSDGGAYGPLYSAIHAPGAYRAAVQSAEKRLSRGVGPSEAQGQRAAMQGSAQPPQDSDGDMDALAATTRRSGSPRLMLTVSPGYTVPGDAAE